PQKYASGAEAVKLHLWGGGSLLSRRTDPDRRSSGRSAVCSFRTDLLYCRRGKEYIWDRMFPSDEYRRKAGVLEKRTCHDDRVGAGWESELRPGRLYLCRRSGSAVAAR